MSTNDDMLCEETPNKLLVDNIYDGFMISHRKVIYGVSTLSIDNNDNHCQLYNNFSSKLYNNFISKLYNNFLSKLSEKINDGFMVSHRKLIHGLSDNHNSPI
jgi:hypothetical protein